MYEVPHFKASDKSQLISLIETKPLAVVSGVTPKGKIVSTHIPLLLKIEDDQWCFYGHMMKHSDHFKLFSQNQYVHLVFNGPQGYVSSSWYTETNKASTWNYTTVHIDGKINFFEGEAFEQLMQEFTLLYEEGNSNSQTVYNNLPKDYKAQNMPHITGFKVITENIENTFKLSQNINDESF